MNTHVWLQVSICTEGFQNAMGTGLKSPRHRKWIVMIPYFFRDQEGGKTPENHISWSISLDKMTLQTAIDVSTSLLYAGESRSFSFTVGGESSSRFQCFKLNIDF